MKRNILIIILFLISCKVIAQFQNADAVYEKLIREYTLNEDMSLSFREYKQLKLLTQLSFNRLYGETFIVYNPQYQQLKINDAYTIMANGKKIITPENAFNEVLPSSASLSATANHLREMVVTHTALEIGATIYLDYTLNSTRGFLPGLMGSELIQESSPVNEMQIIVKVPESTTLNYQMYGLRTAPEILKRDNQSIYIWNFNNIPASAKEGFRGKWLPNVPRLTFSTAGSMDDVVKWLVSQPAFDMKINLQMKNIVDSIKARNNNEIKTILDIRQEVVNNYAFERYEPSWLGYKVRTPEMVWKSNGGNILEKTLLLAALLKHADLDAIPVMIGSQKFVDANAGNLSLFEDFAVRVSTKNHGTIYLSANSSHNQTLEYSLIQSAIVPLSKNNEKILSPMSVKNSIVFNSDIEISNDLKPSGKAYTELTGAVNPFLFLQNDKNSFRSYLTGGLLKGDESIELKNSDISISKLNLKLESDKSITENAGYYQWILPMVNTGFEQWRVNYLDNNRTEPFVIPFTISEKYQYSIALPKDYVFVNKAVTQRLECKAGFINIEFKPKNNKIEIVREINIDETMINPEDYPAFRKTINAWIDKNQKTVIFKKK
ncbi:MAG: DUF3857 domain-containing protein [Bacteroidales bacterium]